MTVIKSIFEKVELDFNFKKFTFIQELMSSMISSMNIQANLFNMVILKFIF